jgi:uncharacterized protein (TIGR00369 family)
MTVHEQWLQKLKNFPGNLKLPPPTLMELGLEYVEMVENKKMVASVPFQKRFTNPVGLYQGGVLSACVDEVFGPLSYLAANGPCITLSMNMTFLGAFKEDMGQCLIEAVVLKQTKNFIFLRAEVKTKEGELIAHSESHVKIL